MKRTWILALLAVVVACARPAGPPAPAPGERPADAPPVREHRDPQAEALMRVARLQVEPRTLELTVGERAPIRIGAFDREGRPVQGAPLRVFGADGIVRVRGSTGEVEGSRPGRGTLIIEAPAPEGTRLRPVVAEVPVVVGDLPVARVRIEQAPAVVYAGTTARLHAQAINTFGNPRAGSTVRWSSDSPAVLDVSQGGVARARKPGTATLTAAVDGARETVTIEVRANPARSITLEPSESRVRTGDVVRLEAVVRDRAERPVPEAEPVLSLASDPGAEEAGALVFADGAFVAEDAGTYTVVATFGNLVAEAVITARPRDVRQEIVVLDHKGHPWTAMTDLWVFEGNDGRDYAYTGTKQPGGRLYAWDVTDPHNVVLTDSVLIDARTINDVKVSADARFAIATREGASDRKNGIVVLDLADPAHPKVASTFTEELTGGVHNTWIEGNLVYAIHNGTRAMHIVDVSELSAPRAVGRWGLETVDRYLHDVQIENGLAYLSYWNDGLIILDVGNGIKGGTPTEPKLVAQTKYPVGNTHAAYPYKHYVFVTDEIFDAPGVPRGTPRGYVHIFDVRDVENPVEVAKFEVPEAGTHNMWIEDDVLYLAYYQGGLRVIDVSGELRGDLYEQGREIAHLATDATEEEGAWFANQSRVWAPQLHKGTIFLSDKYSGLWSTRLIPRREAADASDD